MAEGTLKMWNSGRGFGFIKPDDGGPEVFVHITAFDKANLGSPEEGDRLSYEVEIAGRSGKPAAVNLQELS